MKKGSKKILNYYELLGINPKAGPEEIKRAYYEQLKVWHPDKNADRIEEAEETTKILNQDLKLFEFP